MMMQQNSYSFPTASQIGLFSDAPIYTLPLSAQTSAWTPSPPSFDAASPSSFTPTTPHLVESLADAPATSSLSPSTSHPLPVESVTPLNSSYTSHLPDHPAVSASNLSPTSSTFEHLASSSQASEDMTSSLAQTSAPTTHSVNEAPNVPALEPSSAIFYSHDSAPSAAQPDIDSLCSALSQSAVFHESDAAAPPRSSSELAPTESAPQALGVALESTWGATSSPASSSQPILAPTPVPAAARSALHSILASESSSFNVHSQPSSSTLPEPTQTKTTAKSKTLEKHKGKGKGKGKAVAHKGPVAVNKIAASVKRAVRGPAPAHVEKQYQPPVEPRPDDMQATNAEGFVITRPNTPSGDASSSQTKEQKEKEKEKEEKEKEEKEKEEKEKEEKEKEKKAWKKDDLKRDLNKKKK